MQYLCALIQDLEQRPHIRGQLRFYPNDSLYALGGKYRYVEYRYRRSKRLHDVVSVEIDDALARTLDVAKNGATIDTLCAALTDDDITTEDARAYIEEIIRSQILKSDLDPQVVGDDALSVLIGKLSRLRNIPEIDDLEKIRALLTEIDSSPVGTTLASYPQITTLLDGLGVEYDPKYLFQTDMFKPVKSAVLSTRIVKGLERLIVFLSRISSQRNPATLSRFIEAFQNRYENSEVPLAHALDGELGLGYPVSASSGNGISPLVDDLVMPRRGSDTIDIKLSRTDRILLHKYVRCIRDQETTVMLTDEDFENTSFRNTLSPTFSVLCSLLDDGRIHVKSIGGACGGSLLGRFAHLDDELADLFREVCEKDGTEYPDAIVAEIAHLPESRVGNVASRPLTRDYTLHYLSNFDRHAEDITIEDLMLSVRGGRIVLRSKKYDKEVVPRLTCAHNHSSSTIPIYRFLCDLQYQGCVLSLRCDWNPQLFSDFDYLPRIQYENMILGRQMWRVKSHDIRMLAKASDEALLSEISEFRRAKRIPRHVVIPDFDNELYLDLCDIACLRMLVGTALKRPEIILEEFLFDVSNTVVRQGEDTYTNELIILFHKQDKA